MNLNKSGKHIGFIDENGMTLVESMIAMFVLLLGLLSIAQVLAFSLVASKTYGKDAMQTTSAAHDKIEELVALSFTDTTTNTTVDPPYTADGVGLSAGGSVAPDSPVAGYADYLGLDGKRTTSGNAALTRQWEIVDDSTNLKRIIVRVTSDKSFKYGVAPSTTLVTQKTP